MKKLLFFTFTCLILINTILLGEVEASEEVINNIQKSLSSSESSANTGSGDGTNSGVDSKNQKSSTINIKDEEIPDTSSYLKNNNEVGYSKPTEELSSYESIDYLGMHYKDKIRINHEYQIIEKDMLVRNTTAIDEGKQYIEYTTIKKGTVVTVEGFTNPKPIVFVRLKVGDKKYYEEVVSFYNNTIESNSGKVEVIKKQALINIVGAGSAKGYLFSILTAISLTFSISFLIKSLDKAVFKPSSNGRNIVPYLNKVFRILPGAMIGSFFTVINIFDSHAISYYFFGGASITGKGYRLSHWIIQIIIIIAAILIVKIILEGIRCFTYPCVVIRTTILLIANISMLYLCYTLSFVGVAVYAVLIVYQCVYYESMFITKDAVLQSEEAPQAT